MANRSWHGVGRRGGLPDDLDVIGGLEQLPHPTSDHLVIVEEEHPDHDRTRDRWSGVTVIAADATATTP